MSERLTDRLVKKLAPPEKGNRIAYDGETPGFGCRVTAKGMKTFILNYHAAGRERRASIGQYPTWSVQAAREEAKRLRRDVDRGLDPLASKSEASQAPTVIGLWLEYQDRHLHKLAPRSQKDIRQMWCRYILPELKHRTLADLHARDIDDLHRKVSVVGKIRANRVVENFRSVLNLAVKWDQLAKNPADGFSHNPEEPRSTYLTREQVLVAMEALNRLENQQAANAIRLFILTGARRSEVLKAEWDQFDLEKGLWVKPSSHTKQRREHRVPLSDEACQLLTRMQADAGTSPYLFPSTSGRPIPDIKRPWEHIREALGMPELRIHDLRHTYASLLISAGEPLAVIGRLLGHSQYQTTLRYAHLLDEPLRAATNRIGVMTTAGDTNES